MSRAAELPPRSRLYAVSALGPGPGTPGAWRPLPTASPPVSRRPRPAPRPGAPPGGGDRRRGRAGSGHRTCGPSTAPTRGIGRVLRPFASGRGGSASRPGRLFLAPHHHVYGATARGSAAAVPAPRPFGHPTSAPAASPDRFTRHTEGKQAFNRPFSADSGAAAAHPAHLPLPSSTTLPSARLRANGVDRVPATLRSTDPLPLNAGPVKPREATRTPATPRRPAPAGCRRRVRGGGAPESSRPPH